MTSTIPEPQQRLRVDHRGCTFRLWRALQCRAAVNEYDIDAVELESERDELFDEDHKTRLFEECLKKVLPICNGKAQAKNKDIINVKSCKVRENLEAYSRIHKETDSDKLYPPFVEAANTALLFLQELEVTDLRWGNDFICFHVLDPSVLVQEHQGNQSWRKPDVIVVLELAAREAHGPSRDIYHTDNFLLKIATKHPKNPFQWRSVYTFVEFKKAEKPMEPPPELYTVQPTPPTEGYLRIHGSGPVSALPATPASSSANRPLRPLGPVRRSDRPYEEAMSTNSKDRKRTSAHLSPSTSKPKRARIDDKTAHDSIVQAGSYAAEMFSARVGRLHVIGLIIVGDMLYLWRYDREGAVQCSGFNFIQDLPRFLVLLLAMQRFENRDWGLHQHIDPTFKPRESQTMTLCSDDEKEIEITLELSDADRVTPFGVSGRATNVFSAKICAESRNLSGEDDIVVKVFWPETKRTSEPDILKKVDDIAKHNDDVKGHVPQMLWHRKFEDTSTANVRERLGLTSQGSRVLHMIIFRRLSPIHELTGNEPLQVWWATVKCHLALWKNGVYHRDVSESNLMYRRDEGEIVGVLNDFDLASIRETATGTERTGTILSMALALLDGVGLRGGKRHLYEHDAESFIWVLSWVTLQYGNGKPRHEDYRPLDGWLGKDATQCREKRLSFLYDDTRWALSAGEGHGQNWELAKDCIHALKSAMTRNRPDDGPLPPLDIDVAFETLLDAPIRTFL